MSAVAPALSLILPANNEAAHIERCLDAVLASDFPRNDAVQIIVVPNGCRDETADIARSFQMRAQVLGWQLDVIELEQGSKLVALNAADRAVKAPLRAYLDADVIVSPALLAEITDALGGDKPVYASGAVRLSRAKSGFTRAYAQFYLQTPFMKQPAPGCGFFAMNSAGRARFGDWPAIISDDTFARLKFAPDERHEVRASYEWPLVEGVKNLIRVRRRQNAGVHELNAKFPDLLRNDAKLRFAPRAVLKAVLRHPIGTLAYGIVSLTVKLTPSRTSTWERGR